MGTTSIGAVPGESGVTVDTVEPAPAAVASPFGSTLLVGAYQWGPIDTVILHTGQGQYKSLRGDPRREDPTPLNAEHFLRKARGAGRLLTLRLTDGNEEQSIRDVYARDIGETREILLPDPIPTRAMRVSGLYAGRRGGPRNINAGHLADLAAAFDATAGTFATGVAADVNQWDEATLRLGGIVRSYRVTGNSAAGVLSIEVPAGDPGPTGAGFWVVEITSPDASNVREGVAVAVDASQQNPGTEFALTLADSRTVKAVNPFYDSLSLDQALDAFIEDRVNRDGQNDRQFFVSVDAFDVGDPAADELQPANWVGLVLPSTVSGSNVVDLQDFFWARVSGGGGDAYVDPDSIAWPGSRRRMRALCTFTAATTFDVTFQDWEGRALSQAFTVSDSAGGTLDANFVGALGFPTFKLAAGPSPMAAAETITVFFNPLPVGLQTIRGRFYPHGTDAQAGDLRTNVAIRSNTDDQITLPPQTDPSALGMVIPLPPGTTAPTTGPYDMSAAPQRVFTYSLDGAADVVLTTVLTGGAETAAALAFDLNVQELAAHPTPWLFFFDDGGSLAWRAIHNFGTASRLTVRGTGMASLALGIASDADFDGTDGSVVALSFFDDLEFGQDGVATLGTAGEYEAAFDFATSPINDVLDQNLGLIKMGMPGVSGGIESEQNAGIDYGAEVGHTFRAEVDPLDGTSEASAAAHVKDNVTGDRNRALAWDSYGFPRSKPFPGADTAVPMTGAILGMEAALAAERGGYHIAAAGRKANVGDIFRAMASADTGRPAPRKDETILNPVGIQAVQQEGSLIFPNGDRNPEDDYVGTVWKHKVESILHIMHQLEVAGRPFVFEPLDPVTRSRLVASLLPIFRDLDDAGWFVRANGDTFFDRVKIAAGPDENPPSVQVLGELRAVIEISGIVGTAERVIFTLGTGGVSAGTA